MTLSSRWMTAVGESFLLLVFSSVLVGAASNKEVVVQPGDDVRALVNSNPAGTTFHFKAGLYRGVSITPKDRDVFQGDPGAILNGSQVLKFQRRGQYWVASGYTNPDEEAVMRQGLPVQIPGGGPGGQMGQGGPRGQGQGGGRGGFGGFGGRGPFGFPGRRRRRWTSRWRRWRWPRWSTEGISRTLPAGISSLHFSGRCLCR